MHTSPPRIRQIARTIRKPASSSSEWPCTLWTYGAEECRPRSSPQDRRNTIEFCQNRVQRFCNFLVSSTVIQDLEWRPPHSFGSSPVGRQNHVRLKLNEILRYKWDRKAQVDVVGSRTGAMLLRFGLSVAPSFGWECLTSQTASWFPAPASSNPSWRFPAMGLPAS